MDDAGHVSLTDFGMAKIIRKDEVAQSFCGTPEYLGLRELIKRLFFYKLFFATQLLRSSQVKATESLLIGGVSEY